jgi:multimeric flavodoxin WrbA
MGKILVVYHTLSGNTEKMANAVAEGAKSISGTEVTVKKALEATLEDFVECDGVALGSADYFSYIAGGLKDFFDRTFYPSRGKVDGKPYVAFTTGGGGGDTVMAVLERIAGNAFKLKKLADGVSAGGRISDSDLNACKEIGKTLAEAVK